MIYMKSHHLYTAFFSLVLMTSAGRAQTIWDDAAGDASYSDSGNWIGNAVPAASGANIVIGTMQTGDNIVGIDTAGDVTVNSWTFAATLSNLGAPVQVFNDGSGQQLTLTSASGITNASTLPNEFDVVVNAGADMVFNGGVGGLYFQSALNINTHNVTTSGTVTVDPGQDIIFDIGSASNYGKIGAVIATGTTIQIVGDNYTASPGDTFHFTTGNFNGATLQDLPSLPTGLNWDTSNFVSEGVLTVQGVPEPSTYALLLGGVALLGWIRRRSVHSR